VIGAKLHNAWAQAAADWPSFSQKFAPQVSSFTHWLLAQARGTFLAILLMIGAIICAAITLGFAERARRFILSIFARVAGGRERGEHYMTVISATVRSVAVGVIFVAFIQALLLGIGFFAIGVPGAGLLALIVLVLGILQVPAMIVALPTMIYAFSAETTTVAIIYSIWAVIGGSSDAVLKPLLIGHGLEVPMPVILLGVIGGAIAYGLVGLFVGAVLLAIGWVLLIEWLEAPQSAEEKRSPPKKRLQAAE
jgi:predicted PurR-regulated permease PerM